MTSPELEPNKVMDNQSTVDGPVTVHLNAGGKAQRLQGAVEADERGFISKPTIEIGGRPALQIAAVQLQELTSGSTYIVATGDDLRAVNLVHQMPGYGANLYPLYAASPRGTGGDLLLAVEQHDSLYADTIIAANADSLFRQTDLENLKPTFSEFMKFHKESRAAMTMLLTLGQIMLNGQDISNKNAYYVDRNGKVVFCAEASQNILSEEEAKPVSDYQGSSIGIMAINKAFLDDMGSQPRGAELSLYGDLVAEAILKDRMMAFNGGEISFIDIGTPDSLKYAQSHPELFNS